MIDTMIPDKPINVPPGYGWVKWTSAFAKAWNIASTHKAGILTVMGEGGSGKSVLLTMLYSRSPETTLAVAPTGIAAFRLQQENVKATTLNSAFRFGYEPWHGPDNIEPKAVKMLKNVSLVLVDEVSMVSANVMDLILCQIEEAERKYKRDIPVILFGDIYQLPPVVKTNSEALKEMWNSHYEGHMFFYSRRYMEKEHQSIELVDTFRQQSQIFSGILSRMRKGQSTEDDLRLLNRHVFDDSSYRKTIGRYGMTYIAATNDRVSELNEKYINEFKQRGIEGKTYKAQFTNDLGCRDFNIDSDITTIYRGMTVMCLANERDENGELIYQNGTLCSIRGFDKDGYPIAVTDDGRRFSIKEYVSTKYIAYSNNRQLVMEEAGTMTRIACRPAYAVTFHKAQGLTINAVYIDIPAVPPKGRCRRKDEFIADGSVYLGLSRLRSYTGLGLIRPLTMEDIRLSPETYKFYEREKPLKLSSMENC